MVLDGHDFLEMLLIGNGIRIMKSLAKKIITIILRLEAQAVLRKYKPKIVAVIGSVGKTSTKDAIYAVFSREFFTRRSEKSFNTEIGIPLAIIGCHNEWNNVFGWMQNLFRGLLLILFRREYPEWLILEIGVDRPGDMKSAAKWIHPDIIVITRFADVPVHVEFFDSPEALIEEKASLISSLKQDGLLILNRDDGKVMALKEKWKGKTATFGFEEGADIRASNLSLLYGEDDLERKIPAGVMFRIDTNGKTFPVRLFGTLGKAAAYSASAALAAGISREINPVKISEAFLQIIPPPGRMRILPGIKKTFIIDDSYNASPVAMISALETLRSLESYGRKIAVLGDMLELGKYSTDEHKKIGALAGSFCSILITVGMRARYIADGALNSGLSEKHIYQFENSREAGKYLEKMLKEGDAVLIKGSQGSGAQSIRMERAVEEIMAEPERAGELLARQGDEWEKR
jgi:UDP-N-acetylmuramoyl-tripeptide--D-alanyl-D-alanine ligase